MKDFRNYKDTVKEAVGRVNENTTWKWSATVNKNEIKLTNGYIKGEYHGDLKDYFSVKFDEAQEDECLIGKDCFGETFAYRIVGTENFWEDGTLENCIASTIRSANGFFSNRY